MRFSRNLSPLLLLLLALILSTCLLLAACSGDETDATDTTVGESGSGDGSGSASTDTVNDEEPELSTEPGLHDLGDGTVQAVGVFTFRDVEGGYWAVVNTTDPAEAAEAEIVAVLGGPADIPVPVKSYENKLVSVVGVPRENDIYQAGQFVELTSMDVIGSGTE